MNDVGRPPTVPPIRVLLVDDHEAVREGLRMLLEAQPDMTVVGEAGDGAAALAQLGALQPTVVVLDVSMPHMSGLETTRMMKAAAGDVCVVAFTRHDDDAYVAELLAAGASAYVLKQSASKQLLQAIRACAAGERYVDERLQGRSAESHEARRTTEPVAARVSAREKAVLRAMAVGLSNKETATTLDISIKTVEGHKANAMRKLGLRSRIEVVRYAILQGWLRDPEGL